MTNRTHHVFFSYARTDNGEENNHFVSRFHDLLLKEHQAVTGRELKTFFDTQAIGEGEHWKTRLGQGLRDSRLFLAFLSDNYLQSEVCRWEWEHYLLTEHTAARGEDGVVPLYFIPIDELGKASEAQLAEWVVEIKQRNLGAYCQLQPWYKAGSERAQELDAAERAGALRQVDVESEQDLPLSERVRRLNLRICRRLDRIHLADQVIGNTGRPYRHFVGRHKQLRELHETLTAKQTELLATVHSPGGLGKSALARQYAAAYADWYAAGGVWELKCANLSHLGDALRQLEQPEELKKHGFTLEEVREKSPGEQARSALAQLKRITRERRETVNAQLRNLEHRRTPEDQLEAHEDSRCLLILDNVDDTAMLAADQLNLIPAEDWLSVIVTTRLSPDSFGAATSLKSIEVPPLTLAEGRELLRTFMPGEAFPDQEEAKAAEELVKAFDGYTIALELIGAFVNTNWKAGARLSKYLRTLDKKGLAATDQLAGKKGIDDKIAYQHRQIALIVSDSLSSLRQQLAEEHGEEMATAAQQIIEIASLLQPDTIPVLWLEAMLQQAHPDLEETDEGLEPWGIILQAMMQLSLLNPAERRSREQEESTAVLRMHRVTAAHIANGLGDAADWHWNQIEGYLDRLKDQLQDASLATLAERNQHQQWLIVQAPHLIEQHSTPRILRSLHVAVELEGTHGSLNLAMEMADWILKPRKTIATAHPDSAEAARDLSMSQEKLGDFHLQRGQLGDAERAFGYYEASLKIAEDLYRRNPNSAEAARDLSISQQKLGDFYLGRGQPGDAERALGYYEASLKIAEGLHHRNPDSAQAARDLSVSQGKLGDFHLRCGQPGDEARALRYYEASLKIAEDLHRRNPESAKASRDLSISQERLGDFHLDRAQPCDADRALGYYDALHKSLEDMYHLNPDSARATWKLLKWQEKLGDLYLERAQPGDVDRALDYYQARENMLEDRHRRNPDNAGVSRALSIWQKRLGDFHLELGQPGDEERVLRYYEAELETREDLHRRNPDSARAARDLSISQQKLGDFYLERGQPGDAERGLRYYEANVKTAEEQHRRNRDSVQAARRLSIAHGELGEILSQRGQSGDTEQALQHFEVALEIDKELHRRNPDSAESARDLSISQRDLGYMLSKRNQADNLARALALLEASLKIFKDLRYSNPDSAEALRDLFISRYVLIDVFRRRGQPGDDRRALAHFDAAINGFKMLAQEAKAEPELLQQLVTECWNFAVVERRLKNPSSAYQQACEEIYLFVKMMLDNNIPLSEQNEELLEKLEQMLSSDQSS